MTVDDGDTSAAGPTNAEHTDPVLIAAVRGGDVAAYDVIYQRHVGAARRLARSLTRDGHEIDDLVAESFLRLLTALTAGGGPDVAVRPYLLVIIRNVFYDTMRRRRIDAGGEVSGHDASVPFVDTAVEELERSLIGQAFAKLPERWQLVLWHTEVEGESPAAIAALLGLTPNAVAALAYRAREGLRVRYLREHVAAAANEDCQWTTDRLAAYLRSGLSTREHARVHAHVATCADCHVLFVELGDVNAGLGAILGPAVLGAAAAGYTGTANVAAAGSPARLLRRRSTQAALVGVVLAALTAVLLLQSSQPVPSPPAAASVPPVSGAPRTPAASGTAVAGDTTSPSQPGATAPQATTRLDASLEPVGALVRGRTGVLALTVTNSGPPAAAGHIPRLAGQYGLSAAGLVAHGRGDSGPLTAMLTVPAGVILRAMEAGDGWTCDPVTNAIRCVRGPLAVHTTSRAFVAVNVSTTASGTPSVRLTAPDASVATSSSARGVQTGGLAAVLAINTPAALAIGGNSLLSCPPIALTCEAARAGTDALGLLDNGNYVMVPYRDPAAPAGAPAGAAVSGADIAAPGPVTWAGLYWAGSGPAPATPMAYLRVPGSDRYTPVPASRVDPVAAADFGQDAYQASADVTALIRSSGGRWWVAVDAAGLDHGLNAFAGWALMIVYNDGGPKRTVAVFDGCTPLRGTQTFTSTVYGTPGANAHVGFIGWEGDRGITGDQLVLGHQPLGDTGNIAASRTDGTPQGWNTFGVDARTLDATVPTTPDQPAVTASTSGDAWLLGAITVIT